MPQNAKRPREERSVGWATECLCLRKNRALRGLSFEDMESPTEIPDKGETPEEIYDAMVSRAGALWGQVGPHGANQNALSHPEKPTLCVWNRRVK